MLNRFEQVLREHDLVASGDRLLVAVSGGADSMALLHLLAQLAPGFPFSIVVAHLDHQLRSDSAEDANFVADVCRKLDLHLVLERSDVRAHSEAAGTGVEEAGRQLRRQFLERTASKQDCASIFLAHHADDQAETILFRMLRGSGLSGLAAMRRKAGRYIRPLLGFRAAELREYLQTREISWREDASNADTTFTRNRIRHLLMPELVAYNPKLVEALNRLGQQAADEEDYWLVQAAHFLAENSEQTEEGFAVSIPALAECSRAERRRYLRALLRQSRDDLSGIDAGHIDQVEAMITAERPQADLDLPGLWVGRRYDRLLCGAARPEENDYIMEIPGPGEYLLPGGDRLLFSVDDSGEENSHTALFSPSALSFPLVVRSPRPGDCFQPSGMDGTKRLKDYFVDAKIGREERWRTPVVCCGDEIVWLAGRRRCGRYYPSADEKLLKIVLLTAKQAVE